MPLSTPVESWPSGAGPKLTRFLRSPQYTSKDYATLARANAVVLSFSATDCAYDSFVVEPFFATIKENWSPLRAWRSVAELRRAVFDYVEGWYNPYRLHSSLSYMSCAHWEAFHRTPPPRRNNRLSNPVRESGGTPAAPKRPER